LATKKHRIEKTVLQYILIQLLIYLLKKSGGYNQKLIKEYKTYLDQLKFSKKLDKQMREEIERYLNSKKSIDELMKENFPEPKFVCPDLETLHRSQSGQ